ncbi:MAG: hypothetical protein WAS33_24850 [Candidatus Promineifilaceae bacterium]
MAEFEAIQIASVLENLWDSKESCSTSSSNADAEDGYCPVGS